MAKANFLQQVITDDGFVAANALAKALHITQNDLADMTGLSRDSVSKRTRMHGRATQAQLRGTVEIINRVAAWSGGEGRAFAWFRSQPLSSFGDKTAEDLVKKAGLQLQINKFAGAVVPSFAPGCNHAHRNLVFWQWGDKFPHAVNVIDDLGRLPKKLDSWW